MKLQSLIIHEYKVFITACMFFTRLPLPAIKNYSPDYLQQSSKYFSWVGILVGCLAFLPIYFFHHFFDWQITIFLSMATSILVTGAFHEDGFADCCDAFGGGWTKDKILTIMKDSRLGTYGVIGLIGMLGFKYCLLLNLSSKINISSLFLIFILAHSLSRLAAVGMMQYLPYVQDIDASKAKPLANKKLTSFQGSIAIIGGALSFIFTSPTFLLIIVPIIAAFVYIKIFFNKWIGGYTGDCLGATQQIVEIIIYFFSIIITSLP